MSLKKRLYLILTLLLLVELIVWSQVFARPKEGKLEMYFFDIGQGDSSLVLFPSGQKLLIDGGASGPALLEELNASLEATDRYIDLVALSHSHFDHYGGLIDLLKSYDVGAFIGNGRVGDAAAYPELSRRLEEHDIPFIRVQEGDSLRVGEAVLEVLSPSQNELLSSDPNDTSLVLLLSLENFRALFTGDIGLKTEERIVQKYDLDVDVLKVPHQGSKTSSGQGFLNELSPSVSVIMVGKNNYGHPHQEVLDRLQNYLRTDEMGTIKVVKQDKELEVWRR